MLTDPEGTPLAVVAIESAYDAGNLAGIQGPVTQLRRNEYGPYRYLYITPQQVRRHYGATAVTVPVAGPLTESDLAGIRAVAGENDVVLLALAGTGTPERLSPVALIRATLAAARLLPSAAVVAVPLAKRGNAAADSEVRRRVLRAYAPGRIVQVISEGVLPRQVAEVVERDRPRRIQQGLVLFFTGLSGSGKSTLARALHDVLLERGERTLTCLDGDVVRRNLSAGLSFSRQDRATNILRLGWVAAEISRHRGIAICSPIAPFDATRKQVRQMVESAGSAFVLVHVATPLPECERRDRKGLYARARAGEIPDFTGISSPYEEPDDAAIRVDTTGRSVRTVLADILEVLYQEGYLARPQPEPDQEPRPLSARPVCPPP
jgi:sulfate adenylyltransferase